MWRKVIWAQVLNVGVRPRAGKEIANQHCTLGKISSGVENSEEEDRHTLIPPPRSHTQILTILRLGDIDVLVVRLRYRIICLPRTFFDEVFADAVGHVCFCD